MEFYFCSKYLYENLFLSGQIGNKDHTFINDLSGDGNAFSHCKGCKDSSDSKTFDVTEEDTSHTCSCKQTDNVKRDFNNLILLLYDLGEFPWEKIGRNDRKTTAVGKRYTDTDQYIADHKIKNPVSDAGWKNVDPQFMDIEQFPKEKTNDKAAQILRNEFLS